VLYALGADQLIRDRLDCARFALDNDDFQAIIVIQMNMQGGENLLVMIVLQVRQFLIQHPDMMIVNHGDRTHYLAIRRFPRFLDQFITDHVAKGFGAIGITSGGNQFIELGEEVGIDCDADAAEFTHSGDYNCARKNARFWQQPWPGTRFTKIRMELLCLGGSLTVFRPSFFLGSCNTLSCFRA